MERGGCHPGTLDVRVGRLAFKSRTISLALAILCKDLFLLFLNTCCLLETGCLRIPYDVGAGLELQIFQLAHFTAEMAGVYYHV